MKRLTSIGVIDDSNKHIVHKTLLKLEQKVYENRMLYKMLYDMGLTDEANEYLAKVDMLIIEISELQSRL